MKNDKRFTNFTRDIKNEKSELDRRKEIIESYIIDINNKLYELCSFMKLDLDEIKQIHPDKDVRKKRRENGFGDDEKRAIVAAVLADERKDEIKKQAMEAAGISEDEFSLFLNEDVLQRMAKDAENVVADKRAIKSHNGLVPPKTDWERIEVSKDEKEKILNSVRANPKSNLFSKDFKWNPKDFLGAFKYLEESKEYNGPFIVSVIDKKPELKKYSINPFFSEKISNIYLGKYVLLSIYDITALNDTPKTINLGLEYLSLEGRLKFDFAKANGKGNISLSQKKLIKEFLNSMDIYFDNEHEDLNH